MISLEVLNITFRHKLTHAHCVHTHPLVTLHHGKHININVHERDGVFVHVTETESDRGRKREIQRLSHIPIQP